MTNRRKFLVGMGSLAAGSAAAIGSGAFSTVSANRDVAVSVAGDANAYLALRATSAYAKNQSDGELAINFSGGEDDDSGDYTEQNGEGLNTRAETGFEDVFEIQNQGTNGVYVWVATNDPYVGGAQSVEVVAGDENNVGTSRGDNGPVDISLPPGIQGQDQNVTNNGLDNTVGGWVYLNEGEAVGVDLQFFVGDAGPQIWNKEWQFNADVDKPDNSDYKDDSLAGHPEISGTSR